MKQYENVYKSNNVVYARLFDTETKECTTEKHKVVPSVFIPSKEETGFISIPEKRPLKELFFKTSKEYKDNVEMYKNSNVPLYGNSSLEQTYIRRNFPNPLDSYHEFSNMWFWDIETALYPYDYNANTDVVTYIKTKEETYPGIIESQDDITKVSLEALNYLTDNKIEFELLEDMSLYKTDRNSWKPCGHEKSAMATITSIQIYDTKAQAFFIFGLKKDWKNENNFESEYGKIHYIQCASEEKLLELFLKTLHRRDPALMSGWNTNGYDDPYVTNRIIRVLDKRNDLYLYDEKERAYKFNRDCLSGSNVRMLSPFANNIQHREVKTTFGLQDEFKWLGIIQEDYLDMYKKYTYTIHTSYSLDTIASYELGDNKVNHDDFTDFRDFYENNFNTFIEYGIQDVGLLIGLNKKLKLLDLAKFVAYTCGVSMDMIRGTIRQWNSYMYNNHLNKNQVLPLEGKFGKDDKVIIDHAVKMTDLNEDRLKTFKSLQNNPELHGQKFPGGITRGTGKFWREVFSLDFGSLYPSAIQWANIGIETLIQPKDLPKELLDLRAKYAIYYPKNVESKDLIQFDFDFVENVLNNKKVSDEMNKVLTKHNVCMTPNGMFFRLNERSVLSQTMEDIIVQRKVHKGNMKTCFKDIQAYKDEKDNSTDKDRIKELDTLIFNRSAEADMYNVFQMGLKILVNSAYGSLSMQATVFAGDKEFFSGAVTSSSRISNLIAGQVNSKKVDEICGTEAKEIKYGFKSYLDHIPQQDTDSVVGDSTVYANNNKIKIEDLYKNTSGVIETRDSDNFIKHVDQEVLTLSFNKEKEILENKKIKYIMAHKVNKRMFKIKHKDSEVIVTEDHSVIIKRNNKFLDIKPKDIIKGDKIIINKSTLEYCDFIVEDLDVQEYWVYDIEVEDNHNFFANDICVHNSNYVSIEQVLIKKFGKDYVTELSRRRITEFVENYINKVSLPITYEALKNVSNTLNAMMPEKLVEDPEVICSEFISLAPKMYAARKHWDEGMHLTKPKLKVTGLSTVRSSTPKFYRKELEGAIDILLDGDIPKVIEYCKDVRKRTNDQDISQICINQGVSSLDYTWDENIKKYRRWVPEKNKFLSAPVNSRAALVHNEYIAKENIQVKDIEPGDKIGFIELQLPNPTMQNVMAFQNETVFDNGLDKYVDRDVMYDKGFMKPIHLITDPIGWDLTDPNDQIDLDDW